jgi:hypothetical protein
METFTLVVWLMIGQRYDELRIEDLTRHECAEHVVRIFADRGTSLGRCVSPYRTFPPTEPARETDYCHICPPPNPLPPGHRRI